MNEPIEVDPHKVKVFVHRDRDPAKWNEIRSDIEKRGQIVPGEVRDIRRRPNDERKLPDGNLADYELVTGQGRLLAAQSLGRKFIAFLRQAEEIKIVGSFLSENLNREPLPWWERAMLVKPELDAGRPLEEIAARLSISKAHVQKFARILSKTATGLEKEVAAMPVNDAEVLTALPQTDQAIVIEVFRETGDRDIQNLVRKAREVTAQDGELSKTALQKSLKRVDEELNEVRAELKLTRLHNSLGPQNILRLLEIKELRDELIRRKINVAKFEAVCEA